MDETCDKEKNDGRDRVTGAKSSRTFEEIDPLDGLTRLQRIRERTRGLVQTVVAADLVVHDNRVGRDWQGQL